MRSFHFIFQIPNSSISIDDPYSHDLGRLSCTFALPEGGEIVLMLYDHKASSEGHSLHLGLMAEVDTPGQDIDTALQVAETRVHAILALAVFHSNATVRDIYLLFGYETTQEAEETEFIQIEYVQGELLKSRRKPDHEKLIKLTQVFNSNTDVGVAIAIRWYRKGLTEDDPFDQFLSYWAGLEYLNKSLVRLLGGKPEIRNCSKCGEPYPVPGAKGIGALFAQYSVNKEQDFKRCRDMSKALRHGEIQIVEALTQVHPLAEICRKMLRRGIYLLLKLSNDEEERFATPVYNTHLPRFIYRGFYHVSPSQIPQPYMQPLTTSYELKEVREIDGKRQLAMRATIQPNIDALFSFKADFISEPGIEVQLNNSPHS